MIPNHFSIIIQNDKPIVSYTNEIMKLFKVRLSSNCNKLEFATIKENQVHHIINESSTLVDTEGILFVYESSQDDEDMIQYEKSFQVQTFNPEDTSNNEIKQVL